jgi:hypothetical protein
MTSSLRRAVDDITSVLAKLPKFDSGSLLNPKFLVRGLNRDSLPPSLYNQYSTVGAIVTDPGVMSTSYPISSYSFRDLRLVIYAGNHASDSNFGQFASAEKEIDLPPGTHLKILRVNDFSTIDNSGAEPIKVTERLIFAKVVDGADDHSRDPVLPSAEKFLEYMDKEAGLPVGTN